MAEAGVDPRVWGGGSNGKSVTCISFRDGWALPLRSGADKRDADQQKMSAATPSPACAISIIKNLNSRSQFERNPFALACVFE